MEPYAERIFATYPGRELTDPERERVDALAIPITDLNVEHILYSLGRYVEASFANWCLIAAEVVGQAAARQIAFEAGRRHGGTGYARLLAASGSPGAGTPRLMARYQDLAHALRGPKHSRALFARYDDQACVVTKPACGFYDEGRPESGTYVGAFEAGCFEGYRAADRNLVSVVIERCCWRGDRGCAITFGWRTANAQR